MTAVAALPHLDFALLEDGSGGDVLQQGAIALFVMFLDSANLTKLLGKFGETLFLSGLGKALVHIGPLEILTVSSSAKVLFGGADALKLAQPHLCVVTLVGGGVQEDLSDLLETLFLGRGSKIGVLVRCLGLAGKCSSQVLLGLSSGVLTHGYPLSLPCEHGVRLYKKTLYTSQRRLATTITRYQEPLPRSST